MRPQDLPQIFKGKRIFLTGHTGFKGSWLLQILQHWGADVKGYALAPEHDDDLFNQINGAALCYSHVEGDLLDKSLLHGELVRFQPDFVFHLAAQALVRRSYRMPVETFATNVTGTVHLLEALRALDRPCVAVMVTTDKVYENPERGIPFKEDDALGGHDPYSASKAACELAIDSYRQSFFQPKQQPDITYKSIATARAGNVIGGGDFAEDRLIPDIIRAIRRLENVHLRYPDSVRPWQHVLESLNGYLTLAAQMFQQPKAFNEVFNFGPDATDNKTVRYVAEKMLSYFPGRSELAIQKEVQPHEAGLLLLNSEKAKTRLGWQPRWNSEQSILQTAAWYADQNTPAHKKCLQQIDAYFNGH